MNTVSEDRASGSSSPLFRPVEIGPLRLRNRIAMAPMTREMAPGGVPTRAMADYYALRAKGGTGLIITEGCAPDLTGAFSDRVPRMDTEEAQEGWSRVVNTVKAHDAAIMVQLWHVGAFTPSLIGMENGFPHDMRRISPSGLAAPGEPFGEKMSAREIDNTIASFARAAGVAALLGFHGAEIHAAHGYLPDQFFWGGTNLRTDRYGGDMASRTRFALELIKAVKDEVGKDFALSVRISQWKQLDYAAQVVDSPDALADWVGPLAEAGADMVHVSTRRFWEAGFSGSDKTLASLVREASRLPVIAVGSVTLENDFKSPQGKTRAMPAPEQIARLEDGVRAGEFDLIAIGRALLANPDWADRVACGDIANLKGFDRSMLEQLVP